MIVFNIFLIQLLLTLFNIIYSIKMLVTIKLKKFHSIICKNILFSSIVFFIINTMWQLSGGNTADDFNIFTFDYWGWIIWEYHFIIVLTYSLYKIETLFYKK